jgi:hypothetical protein
MEQQVVTNRDVKLLDEFLTEKGIDYVLTGTAGLYIHGFLPKGYDVHDIDIIVPMNTNDELLVNGVFSEQETLSDCKNESDYFQKVFTFKIGKSGVKVNVFVNNILGNDNSTNFREINFEGHTIKVHSVWNILEAKFKMGRPKDHHFCVKMFTQICAMFPCLKK